MESLADKVVYRQILDDGSKMNLVVKGSINGQLHHKVVQLLVDEKTQVRFHLCECLCFTACEHVLYGESKCSSQHLIAELD